MKRSAILCALLALLLLCTACASKSEPQSFDAEAPAAAPSTGNSAAEYGGYAAYDAAPEEQKADLAETIRKIIYNAHMGVTADDPAAALQTIQQQAEALGGYLAASYLNTDEYGTYHASATLRVPYDKLETLVAAAEETGKVDSYRLESSDITDSYYDVQARLESAKSERTQLRLLLSQCTEMEDLLAVRRELASVQSDIDSYEGSLRLWDNLVDYATLEISVNRTPRAAVEGESELITLWKASDVGKRMSTGFQNSLRFLANFFGGVGIFLASALIPILVIGAVVAVPVVLIVRAKRRRRGKKLAQAAAAADAEKKPDAAG